MANRRNPYVPGTDEWHLWNLKKASWGHIETFTEVEGGVKATGVIYHPDMFYYKIEGAAELPFELTGDPCRWRDTARADDQCTYCGARLLILPDEPSFDDLYDELWPEG